jgi:hypothetical protein
MRDTSLGFMTDRIEVTIADARRRNKRLVPYTYEEIAECCIKAMLNGYGAKTLRRSSQSRFVGQSASTLQYTMLRIINCPHDKFPIILHGCVHFLLIKIDLNDFNKLPIID